MDTMRQEQELDEVLEGFCQEVRGVLGERLISVILHGSVVLDDLAPGYGDLDFLAVVSGDLSEEESGRLVQVRKPLRSGSRGLLGHMLEGAFLPRRMLDPGKGGRALWWGTSGERAWERNELGWFTLWVIRERGRVVWGQDVRDEIPLPPHEGLKEQVRGFCRSGRCDAKAESVHSVDWLLAAARLLLWVKEGRLSSKSEAADWAGIHARGSWRELLPRAKELRLNPTRAEGPEFQEWLNHLMGPIQAACEELEGELGAEGRSSGRSGG